MAESTPESNGRELAEHVLLREISGSSVLLDLEGEKYLGLDETATEMLRQLRDEATFDEAVERLVEIYDTDRATIVSDLQTLVTDLETRGILRSE